MNLQKNRIKLIDVNLLLKKIVENDFIKKDSEILYAFIRQSFYFIKKDIFLKKIINCYEHYKTINIEMNKLANLIYFLNAYIIQMYLYYRLVPKDNNKILGLLKAFYNELIAEKINSIKLLTKLGDTKNVILNDEIYEEYSRRGRKNSIKEIIKNYSNDFVKKKLYNRINRNYIKIIEMEKIQVKQKEKDKMENTLIEKDNKIKMNLSEIEDFEGLKSNSCENTLYLNETGDDLKKEENFLEMENNEKCEKEDCNNKDKIYLKEIEDNELINIIGNEYEDLIKDNKFISEEEQFLFNLKNMLIILNMKNYKESEILKIKRREIFYENFEFYLGENEDNINYSKNKNPSLNKYKTLKTLKTLSDVNKKLNEKKFFSVLDWETYQIGEQLINITINLLNKIEYRELYGAVFTKNAKELNSKNVMENIRKYNNFIMFIIEDILSYDFPKDRAKIIEKWVLIAQYCKNRKDQSNCLAIKSALNHYIITGLNLTFKEIKPKIKLIMNEINDYCNLEGNFKVFREEIKNIKKNEFYVPYLGILLRDLTFFEEGGKYLVQGNIINFEKIEKVQNALDSFFQYKKSINSVKFENIKELNFFENLEQKTEEELENIANQLEPEFKLRLMPQKEKRLTQIDNKYFLNNFKRFSCIINSKTMKNSS